MTVLIPKGLASAVLATLVVGLGLSSGDIVQGTVYSAIFFSIVYCAVMIFWIEHGLLDVPIMASCFGKFSAAPQPGPAESAAASEAACDRPATKHVIELDEILEDLQEPNPIGLEEEEGN